VALLIGQMIKMGLPEVLDRHIPRHWTQRGLSWGWTAVIWLAYIVTEGDHRKVSPSSRARHDADHPEYRIMPSAELSSPYYSILSACCSSLYSA
jgi:transposase